jgi:hypothetical protein
MVLTQREVNLASVTVFPLSRTDLTIGSMVSVGVDQVWKGVLQPADVRVSHMLHS